MDNSPVRQGAAPVVRAAESLMSGTTTVAFTQSGRPSWRRHGLSVFSVPDVVGSATPTSRTPLIAVEYTAGTVSFRGLDATPRRVPPTS